MSFAWSKAEEKHHADKAAVEQLRADILRTRSKRAAFNRAVIEDVDAVAHMPYRRGLFELARRVKAHAEKHRVPTTNGVIDPFLRLLLHHWGQPYTLSAIHTEFKNALDGCKSPKGKGVIDVAADQCRDPATWPAIYDDPETNHLLAVCRNLAALSPEGVFFLGCRSAASICGYMSAVTAGNQLKRLLDDGWITLVEAHTTARARRFRLGKKNGN